MRKKKPTVIPTPPPPVTPPPVNTFKVYDATGFKLKPSQPLPGCAAIAMYYQQFMWGPNPNYTEPDLNRVRVVAATMPTDKPVCIDIESWSIKLADLPDTVRKFNLVSAAIRSVNPLIRFGYYGLPPVRNYVATDAYYMPGGGGFVGQTKNLGAGNEWYSVWTKQNLAFAAVDFDYVYPSLYTFYDNQPGWINYALQNISQARQYNKPVLPFIWNQYHESNKTLGGTQIPADYWATQLNTLHTYADSLAIWNGLATFDGTQPWYATTQTFIAGL